MGGENMQNNIWVKMAVLLMSLVLMAAVSCSKKAVTMDNGSVPNANEDSYAKSGVEKSSMQEENMDPAASARESGTTAGIVLQQDVYFEFDKTTLTPDARAALVKNGEWLRINRDVVITIEGHCDERGTNEYNLALGDRRAETVKTFLADLGIQPSRLKTISYGEEQPADPNHSESAWAKNRRAHFLIR
jgi:peptidoglycan-associated lipoprotein